MRLFDYFLPKDTNTLSKKQKPYRIGRILMKYRLLGNKTSDLLNLFLSSGFHRIERRIVLL